jgi:hypothetical protein
MWMSCGLVIYFAYGYKHSKLNGCAVRRAGSVPVGYTPPVAALVGSRTGDNTDECVAGQADVHKTRGRSSTGFDSSSGLLSRCWW